MANVDKEDHERGLQAFLVGRYLKENGLSRTLACFLDETPVRVVPKMEQNDLLSIGGMMKELGWLSRELKEKQKRMQQYEDILNLLFQEIRDVYNFGSSDNRCTHHDSKSAIEDLISCKDDHASSLNSICNSQDDDCKTPISETNDAERLIEEFCLQHNIDPHSGDDVKGKIVANLVPNPLRSGKDGCNFQEGKNRLTQSMDVLSSLDSDLAFSIVANQCIKSKGGKRASPRAHEHCYNRIREYRRLNCRQKYRQHHAQNQTLTVSSRKYKKPLDCKKKTEVRAAIQMPHNCTVDWANHHSAIAVDVIIGKQGNVCDAKKENGECYGGTINDLRVTSSSSDESSNRACNIDGHQMATVVENVDGRTYDTQEKCSSDWERVKVSATETCESSSLPEFNILDENNAANRFRSHIKHVKKCGMDASGYHKKISREKCFKQGQPYDSSSICSLCTFSDRAANTVDESKVCNNGGNSVTFLATETANLLERLLPLVARPDAMHTFIRKLYMFSVRSSLRGSRRCNADWNHHDHSYVHHQQMLENTGSAETAMSDCHEKASSMDRPNEEKDDIEEGSMLAELEEVVGETVDAIVGRYVSS